jgi:intein/homing endonuclease
VTSLDNYILNPVEGTILSKKINKFLPFQKGFGGEIKVEMSLNGKKKLLKVADLFYSNFIGKILDGYFVGYKDNDKENIKLENLFLVKKGLYNSLSSLRIFTEEDEKEIVKGYVEELKQVIPLSKQFKVAQRTIVAILKAHGVRIRTPRDSDIVPYTLNKRYFQNIDTQEKAYLLGFLFADGHVGLKSNRIELCVNDIEVLNFFIKELEIENKEIYRNPSHNKAVTLSFSCREMKIDLNRVGCTTQKTFTLSFPGYDIISKDIFRHFIRGYFDGDGSVTVKETYSQVHLMSSTVFCNQIKDLLERDFGIMCSKTCSYYPNKKETSEFHITGKQNLSNFRDFLYKDANLFLERKKLNFDRLN